MISAINDAFHLMLLALVGISLVKWCQLLWTRRTLLGHGFLDSLLAPRPRRRPYWTPADALLMFGAMILFSQGLLVAMLRMGWIQRATLEDGSLATSATSLAASVAASSLGGIAAIAVTLTWLRIFSVHPGRDLGLEVSIADVRLGLRSALMILPPVMIISAVVNAIVPYEHPVLQSLEKLVSPSVFFVTFVGTALVTPLVEEFLVRGMLQGSLQGLADRELSVQEANAQEASTQPISESSSWTPKTYWPLLVSSLVFACLHIGGQGAAPIPLFFLSVGLGFLYRQTGSLIPPIVVHMVLNGLTLVVELLRLSST